MKRYWMLLAMMLAAAPSVAAQQTQKVVTTPEGDTITVTVSVSAKADAASVVVDSTVRAFDGNVLTNRSFVRVIDPAPTASVDAIDVLVKRAPPPPAPVIVPLPIPEPVKLGRAMQFAPFHEPMRNINAGLNYTGTVRVMSGSGYKAILDSARAAKSQLGFYLTTDRQRFKKINVLTRDSLGRVTKADTTIGTLHWRAFVLDTLYGPRMATIRPFIDDSTIKFIYGIDEYECSSCWGGMHISHAQVDSLAMFAEQVFKGSDGRPLPWANRVDPSKLTFPWRYVDISWAQFSGATHYPAACGGCGGRWASNKGFALLKAAHPSLVVDTLKLLAPPAPTATTYYAGLEELYYYIGRAFADSMVVAAKVNRLAFVVGANTMDGGDGYSKLKGIGGGTTSWLMHPLEYAGLIRAFTETSYACAVFNWKSSASIGANETVANRTAAVAFDTLAVVRQANARARATVTARTAGPCQPSRP